MTTYHCSYFGTEQGRYPVEGFIDGIDQVAQRKFAYKRSILESLGPRLMEPHAKSLGSGIFELRFSGRDSDFRVLYFFDGDKVIFTNAFKKKTQKAPRNEIELAADRRRLYLSSKLSPSEGKTMRVRLKSVDEHFREKSKDPRFRELLELEEEKAKVASLIVKYRADHHLNQGQLAKRVGVTQQYISKIEEGDFSNLSTIQKIVWVLGYHVSLRVFPLGTRTKHAFQKAA